MSENLVYGQGTYHRTDMLPDSGDEVNSLWARYIAENIEYNFSRRMTCLLQMHFSDFGGAASYPYGKSSSAARPFFVHLRGIGTVYVSAIRIAGSMSMEINGLEVADLGSGAGAAQVITPLGTTLDDITGWGTLTITPRTTGTLSSCMVWGSP